MDLQLKGKKALITGATDGIGFAIAKRLTDEGATVYINGRSPEKMERALSQLKGDVFPFVGDLSDPKTAEDLVKKIPEIDILINNLGIYEVKPFEEIKDEDWIRFFTVNVLSGIRLSRAYLPKMHSKNWGRIIFISSESGINIPAEMIHYGMTKSAQLSISRGLAETTIGTKITVNSILPGPTLSGGVERFIEDLSRSKGMSKQEVEDDFFKKMRPSSLLQRFADPDEVATLVTYVASPLSSAINGSALRVEGGIVRSIV